MERKEYVLYSSNLEKDMRVIRYGTKGVTFLGFPTQCANAGNYEDFGVIRTLQPLLEEGRMQLFTVDTVDSESWYCTDGINSWRSARQESYYRFISRKGQACRHRDRYGGDPCGDRVLQKTGTVQHATGALGHLRFFLLLSWLDGQYAL